MELWKLWEEDATDDENVKIAKDIDKIHMVYKLLRLINETDIGLKEDRIKKFLQEKKKLKSVEGRQIYEILITNNKDFKNILEKY